MSQPEGPKSHTTLADSAVAPGNLSSLLLEIAAAPDQSLSAAWERGLLAGDVVGRFEILREIGRGGFGVVYEARDRELGRLVAFKAIRPGGRDAARLREERLLREAEAAARLSHANIVVLYDYGRWEGGPYLVLERLRGQSLAQRLRRGPLPTRQAVEIAVAVARALAHAHAAGVLHRDLKPGNVFLCTDGNVKVLDFGLAHLFGSERPAAGGTPAYMAPEQRRGEPEDARTDLFALGGLLYEMLSGRAPHPVGSSGSGDAHEVPPAPPALRGLPRRLGALVESCLARAPRRRPESAGAVLATLLRVQAALARRFRGRLAALAAAVALAAVLAAWLFSRGQAFPPGERMLVSVADFANETGEHDLDGLSGMLITSLEQSRRLSVLTRSRMIDLLRQLGREDAARIDEALARDIGHRAGVKALLLGTIRRFEGAYSLELRALDPGTDSYLFGLREQGSGKGTIPGLIDRLSEQARRRLGEPRPEVRASAVAAARAVTASLEAQQHYFLGMDCMDRPSRYPGLHPGPCMAEFRRAVEIDPGFALAWFQLSQAGVPELVPAEGDRKAIEQALRSADAVPPKERTLMQAWAAHLDGRDEEALSLCRQVLASFPDDKQVLFFAGDLAFHRDELGDSVRYLSRVLDLDPTFEFALDHLSYALAVLGRRDELQARVKGWKAMAATPALRRALVNAYIGLGDGAEAVAAARREGETAPAYYSLPDLARALVYTRQYGTLEADLRRHPETRTFTVGIYLAHARSAQGRRAEALATLDAFARGTSDAREQPAIHIVRALHFAGAGDVAGLWDEAVALQALDPHAAGNLAIQLARLGDLARAGELASHLAPGSTSQELYLALVDAANGRAAQARARLQAVESVNPVPREGMSPAFLLGELAAAEGLDAEAVEALRRYQRLYPLGYWQSWAYPRSLFLLARSLERLGKRDEARAEVDRLLRLWTRAEPGLPGLAEARALRAELEVPAGDPRASGGVRPPPAGGASTTFPPR